VPERPSHKLAVIFHADAVGSIVLVQYDETAARQRNQDSFRRFSDTIEAYGSIARELRGNALVAGFDRASDAVCVGITF
jgi:class 3 adenylate cyclase